MYAKKSSVKKCKALLFVGLMFLTVNAASAELLGVHFDTMYKLGNKELKLQGVGDKRFMMMKAFVAGFYLEEGQPQWKALDGVYKHLEVEYFRNIPGKLLTNFTVDCMRLNSTKQEFNSLADRIEIMGDYFVDLRAGDRFSLSYVPGKGTTFSHNGEFVGLIRGDDFARCLFAVWIGERPMDKSLKNEILGLGESSLNVKKAS